MNSSHEFDRYKDAHARFERAKQATYKAGEQLASIASVLKISPLDLKVEGIGEWTEIRADPNVVTQEKWIEFEGLIRLINNYREAQEEENRAWNNLPEDTQSLLTRPSRHM